MGTPEEKVILKSFEKRVKEIEDEMKKEKQSEIEVIHQKFANKQSEIQKNQLAEKVK